jgi:hypothetical protein
MKLGFPLELATRLGDFPIIPKVVFCLHYLSYSSPYFLEYGDYSYFDGKNIESIGKEEVEPNEHHLEVRGLVGERL